MNRHRASLGTYIGRRYRLESLIGTGGMGSVYRATQIELERTVAVKLLSSAHSMPMMEERFRREVLAVARLDHEHCVRVLDAGTTQDGQHYLVMPFLDGKDLRHHMKNPVPPALAIERALQMARGLEHAHQRGIVHRDLKPENVIVTVGESGECLKLVDFGLAKLTQERGSSGTQLRALTQHGVIFGTPDYMSPEQARGDSVDHRTDLYALGAVIYELLMGTPPFVGTQPFDLLRQHLYELPPTLPESFPTPLRQLVADLLHKTPDLRPSSAAEVCERLEGLIEHSPLPTGLAATVAQPPKPAVSHPSIQPRRVSMFASEVSELDDTDDDHWDSGDWALPDHVAPIEHNLGRRRRWLAPILGLAAFAAGVTALWSLPTTVEARVMSATAAVTPSSDHNWLATKLPLAGGLAMEVLHPPTKTPQRGSGSQPVSSDSSKSSPPPSSPAPAKPTTTSTSSSKPRPSNKPSQPSTSARQPQTSTPTTSRRVRLQPRSALPRPPRTTSTPQLPNINDDTTLRLRPGMATTTDTRLPSRS